MDAFFQGITHVRLPHPERYTSTTMDKAREFITKRSDALVLIDSIGQPFNVYSIDALQAYLDKENVSMQVRTSGNTARVCVQNYRRMSAWLTQLTLMRDAQSTYCTLF
jgi:hypothetical protein